MIEPIRKAYNEQFSEEGYRKYLSDLESIFPGQLDFRVAETPVFVPADFTAKMLSACEHIIDVVTSTAYLHESDRAIPQHLKVPNEDAHPQFIAFDFGVCTGKNGGLEPQLIELQAFPSLFCWQVLLAETHQKNFAWPGGYSPYLNGFDREQYVKLLKDVVIGNADVSEVILLEIFPEKQKTRVDFFATEALLGIQTVSLTDLIVRGKDVFYQKDGKLQQVKRIYNRVIFDELMQQEKDVQEKGKIFQQELNVTWVPHPNWFYRISKFTLPFLRHENVPETHFLHERADVPEDLDQYVVKPLFSFAGQGVIIDAKPEDIQNISDPENWILQRKVTYAGAVATPDEPAKVEIRIFYIWPPKADRPVAANHLCRLSKGKMVGVRYNKDKTWVGGSFCLFEP